MTHVPARPRTYDVAGRIPGTGPVIAVLTDGPADVAVAAHAADLAARNGILLITAAAVTTPAFSMNALLHRARARRVLDDRRAITARVTPALHAAGVAHFSTVLHVPPGIDAARALPVAAVHQVINRFGAVAVVSAAPLHDPTGILQPAGPDRRTPAGLPAQAPARSHRPPSTAPW